MAQSWVLILKIKQSQLLHQGQQRIMCKACFVASSIWPTLLLFVCAFINNMWLQNPSILLCVWHSRVCSNLQSPLDTAPLLCHVRMRMTTIYFWRDKANHIEMLQKYPSFVPVGTCIHVHMYLHAQNKNLSGIWIFSTPTLWLVSNHQWGTV